MQVRDQDLPFGLIAEDYFLSEDVLALLLKDHKAFDVTARHAEALRQTSQA